MPEDRYEFEARVVYERAYSHHEADPFEAGKIGVAFGDTVFWTAGYAFPGDNIEAYGKKVGFATELARRWNAALTASEAGK